MLVMKAMGYSMIPPYEPLNTVQKRTGLGVGIQVGASGLEL